MHNVRHHWARFLMLKHIAVVNTMEKLVLFIWSFLIHCGSLKGLLHPPRDSFGKKMYQYVLQKIKITYIVGWKLSKLTLSRKNIARHNFNSRWPMWCLQIITWERTWLNAKFYVIFDLMSETRHSFQSIYLWGILDLTKTNN